MNADVLFLQFMICLLIAFASSQWKMSSLWNAVSTKSISGNLGEEVKKRQQYCLVPYDENLEPTVLVFELEVYSIKSTWFHEMHEPYEDNH